MKLMVISGRGFLPERLTRLLMIDAVQSERLQNLVYPQYIAILLCIVILVYIAVKVANDQRLVVFEVWRILIYDLLRNLGIESFPLSSTSSWAIFPESGSRPRLGECHNSSQDCSNQESRPCLSSK